MLSKKDLRIGNMFEQGIVCKINGRSGAKVHLYGKMKYDKKIKVINSVAVEDLKPIRLTPEILVEWCGFKRMGGDIYCGERFALIFNGEYLILQLGEKIEIRYLHELQNINCALFKKELEIKG